MVEINLGAGRKRLNRSIGLDAVRTSACDVQVNLDGEALPFKSHSIDRVYAYHVLEHIRELPTMMEEIHRVCNKGGEVHIEVPYYTCVGAFGDPTHVRFFTYNTFLFWTQNTEQANWFSKARYTIVRRYMLFGRVHRLMGISFLANRFPNIYENFFAFIFPARFLQVVLATV